YHHHAYFFLHETPTTELYTLSLHDALPIWSVTSKRPSESPPTPSSAPARSNSSPIRARRARNSPPFIASIKSIVSTASAQPPAKDRKSTRLNSSHLGISYAVFCLKKKTTK